VLDNGTQWVLGRIINAGGWGMYSSLPLMRRVGLSFSRILLLFLASTAGATGLQSRASDLVLVEGRLLPDSVHVNVQHLSLLRQRAGSLEAVPFQVDERDDHGAYALPEGPQATADDSPGVFDANDLLVFAAGDCGERGTVEKAAEIRVSDPLSEAQCWVYLRVDPSSEAAGAGRDDVTYDPQTDTVHARGYVLRWGDHTPSFFSFRNAGGTERNLLDRLKARVTARLLWGFLEFNRNEEDITTTVLAWKDGPLRVIRRAQLKVRLGYGLPQPTIIAEDIFTVDAFEGPVIVRLPFNLRYVFGDLTVRIFLDFEDLHGYRLVTATHDAVPIECGTPADGLEGTPADWFAMIGPEGAFVHALQISSTLQELDRRLHVIADREADPPEGTPGNCPGIGYSLTQWSSVGSGIHHIGMIIRALPDYQAGDERVALARLQHPLYGAVPASHDTLHARTEDAHAGGAGM
jgi:hypothetical protein